MFWSTFGTWTRKQLKPLIAIILLSLVGLGLVNSQWLIAQIHVRASRPVVIASTESSALTPDPTKPAMLTIPSISVNAPLILDEPSTADADVQLALRRGVLHYGGSTKPGQPGNTVVVGHSSGVIWAPGDYKWIFTLLEKLKPGDKVNISYQGILYSYTVINSLVVSPNDTSVLASTDQSILTLITCTPVGTDKYRLVVMATLDMVPSRVAIE